MSDPSLDRFRVDPGASVGLESRATDDDLGLTKAKARKVTVQLNQTLTDLQAKLYAEGRHRLLLVLQATDTGGKDGTIRHVFEGVNPSGVRVASFKQPTEEQLAHDYLWRVHPHVPGDGEIVIFNRSHYEDVLIVRVHDLVAPERWRRRYHHIREFERLLSDEGTKILKVFLHISKDEQKRRIQARLDDPTKHWKFHRGDLAERERWDDYQAAFTEAIERTSTAWAPWWVIPADRKWVRNYIVSRLVVGALEDMGLEWPDAEPGLEDIVIT